MNLAEYRKSLPESKPLSKSRVRKIEESVRIQLKQSRLKEVFEEKQNKKKNPL